MQSQNKPTRTAEEIEFWMKEYPELTEDEIEACLDYADYYLTDEAP